MDIYRTKIVIITFKFYVKLPFSECTCIYLNFKHIYGTYNTYSYGH